LKKPYIRLLKTVEGVKVYLVNGGYVRRKHVDFTEGGHDLVYSYIPKNEIWLDNDNYDEKPYILMHELTEREAMKRGLRYSQAHLVANVSETLLRGEKKHG